MGVAHPFRHAGARALLVNQQARIAVALAVGVPRFLERHRPPREALAAIHRDLSPRMP